MSDRDWNLFLANLWAKHGCPERMTIHSKATGKTIYLLNGLPVTDNTKKSALLEHTYKREKSKVREIAAVTDNPVCVVCGKRFSSHRKDASYCSSRCRVKEHRRKTLLDEQKHRQELMKSTGTWEETP